ncbi:SDR family NAD(P)-dependent oxidoreductase [Streptomyces sp. NBC_00365]|uniref:SDR family NAD(P)-dependent oxidoreductase n=1 Tax=Streptomyces sp. NBC_00365 TaxID=2975726 RepID=UPI00225C2583|nr:SDR family NAD(P)-dependent oxidoreductase [Streptomyces sp. NBC_00365]MCX5095271.1 SDR family NAD(P)-dependent oxidoreductase [Streptomyces sp. NBC_00365]
MPSGLETARQLAERGATLLLHGRTAEEARAAADRLIATAGIDADQLRPVAADFTHLDEVESLANCVVAEHPHLDVLVNDAGIAAPERHTVTTDGNEIALQVNFLAHCLLTCLLESALTSDPGGRVVNVSSSLHRTANIQWSDPNRARRYSRLAAYAQSQLALTVFAADPRVTAVSVHPGICDTALMPLYAHGGVTPADGAAYVVRLCDPAVEIVNGAYYDRAERVAPAPAATEDRTIKRLNKLADLLVGRTA